MKNVTRSFAVILAINVIIVSGCAKEDVVKKDEPMAQQQTLQQQTAQQQLSAAPKSEPAKPTDQLQNSTAKASAAVSLQTVYFDFDRSDLRQDSRDMLTKNAQALMKDLVDSKIKIEGHCDERGSDEYNLALGDRRAKAVATYLITLGVKQDRISTVSFGKEKPAMQGSDETAWSKNRRAEFVIVK